MAHATLSYGDRSVDPNALPQASVDALMSRGFSHLMGNEVASKVSAFKEKNPDATEAQIAAAKAEYQDAMLKALAEGTVGTRHGTPRGTAIETVMRSMAEAEVREILKKAGLAAPTGKKTIKLNDGEFTLSELVARRIAGHTDRLKGLAEREMKRRATEAAKVEGLEGL